MKKIIESVISIGDYDLKDILKKIDTVWLKGDITESEKDELIQSAQNNAKPENSYAPLQEQIEQAFSEIEKLKVRITALENGEETEPPVTEEYPEFKQPSGAHDAYKINDKVIFNGQKYICTMEGCVWSPSDYPNAWQKVE